jgi:hypothetical protein
MIENFISNLFGGKVYKKSHKRRSVRKSHKKSSLKHSSPSVRASKLSLGTKKKGRNGKMYQVVMKGKKYGWKVCKKGSCIGVQQGPSPLVGKASGGAKRRSSLKKKSVRKSHKKSSARKSVRKSHKKRSARKMKGGDDSSL